MTEFSITVTEETARAARSTPLTRRFKAQYGVGAMADGFVTAGFGFFLLFYLTAVCGMSGGMAGLAKMIALLVDAVVDPAIGLASDRVRSRLGRRLPFMIISLLPIACAFGLLFSIPDSLTGVSLFIYVTACLIVLRVSTSCFVLPFTAVGAEITDDYRERAGIVSYRLSFQNAGILCAVVLGLGVYMSGPSGLIERENYVPFAWTSAAAIVLTGLVAIWAVRRALPRLHSAHPSETHFLAGFVRELVELVQNRSFLILFGTVLTYFLAYSTSVSLALHATRYFWKLDSFAIQMILLSTTLGPLLGAPISAIALRYIEKRTLAIGAFLCISLFQIWPPLFQLYGPFPFSPSTAAVVLFFNGLLVGTAIMVGGIAFQSMLADTADEHEWMFGVRREGLFFSGLTLAYKAAAGLGGLIAGLALDAIMFPTDIAAKGDSLVIPTQVLDKLGLISGPLPAAFAALSPLFLFGYHLTRKKHKQIIADLEQRNAENNRTTT
ncbi:MFS transporter [Emcibacter sp.]|uniref:MFS transporter n=1 Tax=Emcibacter sp. TaxID=1979954 RepID=UPI003A94DC3B